jgi:hypothetical protein
VFSSSSRSLLGSTFGALLRSGENNALEDEDDDENDYDGACAASPHRPQPR